MVHEIAQFFDLADGLSDDHIEGSVREVLEDDRASNFNIGTMGRGRGLTEKQRARVRQVGARPNGGEGP